jgi:hypothetical protein
MRVARDENSAGITKSEPDGSWRQTLTHMQHRITTEYPRKRRATTACNPLSLRSSWTTPGNWASHNRFRGSCGTAKSESRGATPKAVSSCEAFVYLPGPFRLGRSGNGNPLGKAGRVRHNPPWTKFMVHNDGTFRNQHRPFPEWPRRFEDNGTTFPQRRASSWPPLSFISCQPF